MLAFQPEDRPSISFVQNHVWMRKSREIKCSTWSRCSKKRRESLEKAPIAEISSESTLRASDESEDRVRKLKKIGNINF